MKEVSCVGVFDDDEEAEWSGIMTHNITTTTTTTATLLLLTWSINDINMSILPHTERGSTLDGNSLFAF